MIFWWALLLPGLAAHIPHIGLEQDPHSDIGLLPNGPFSRWLESLTLTIPLPALKRDFKGLFHTFHIEFDLNDLICKKIKMGSLDSSYDFARDTLEIDITGVNVKCELPSWKLSVDHVAVMTWTGSASVVISSSSIRDRVRISGDRLAKRASNEYCNALIHADLDIDLKEIIPISWLVNAILDWLHGTIDGVIDKSLCGELDTLINTNLTNVLLGIDSDIEPLLAPECCNPRPMPYVPPGMIDWSKNKLVSGLEGALTNLVGANGPLGINPVVNKLTNHTGVLNISLEGFSLPFYALGSEITLEVKRLYLDGLNTFNRFEFFGLSGYPNAFNTSMAIENLRIVAELSISVDLGKNSSIVQGGNLTEHFSLALGVDRMDIDLLTVVAMRENRTLDLKLGQLLEPPCLARIFESINFTEILVNFTLGDLEVTAMGGDIEDQLDHTINNLINLFKDRYILVVPGVVHGFLAGPGADLINSELDLLLKNLSGTPCATHHVDPPHLTNWMTGPVGHILEDVNDIIGVTGKLDINWIIGRLIGANSDGHSGKSGNLISFKVQDDLDLTFRDLNVFGAESFTQFQLLEPVDSTTLRTDVVFGNPFNLSAWIDVHVKQEDGDFVDSFRVEIDLSDFALHTSGMLQVDKVPFSNLTVQQLANTGCVFSTLTRAKIQTLTLMINQTYFKLSGGRSVSVHNLERTLLSYEPLITEAANFVFKLGGGYLTNYLNGQAEGEMQQCKFTCQNLTPPDAGSKKDEKKAVIIGLTVGLVSFLIFTAVLLFCCRNKCNFGGKKILMKSSTNEFATTEGAYVQVEEDQKWDMGYTPGNSPGAAETMPVIETVSPPQEKPSSFPPWNCLAANPHIPLLFRVGVPIVLAGNIALFLVSNMGVGAGVKLTIQIGDLTIKTPDLFQFTLSNTVEDMWKAKVYPLSILVAVFSGGWPYLKLVLMQFCWLFPLSWLSQKRREDLLIALDALGKWSLIDTFVLSLMLVAFRISISNPLDEIPTKFLNVDVFVEPGLGFYTFLAATIGSLLTTHICLHYHRFSDPSKKILSGGEKIALCNHVFNGDAYGFEKHHKVRCSMIGKIVVSILLIMTFGIIGAGSVSESFKFEFKGLASIFLGDQRVRSYSLLSITKAIPNASSTPNGAGIIFIQAVMYLVSFVLPITHIVVMFFLWWTPMTASFQYAIFYVTEVLNAWASLDVFVVSIIAAILEISQFATFLVGHRCDAINEFIRKYLGGKVEPETCFTVIATLSDGCWMLFFACVISLVVSQIVMRTCHKAMHDRLAKTQEARMLHEEVKGPHRKDTATSTVTDGGQDKDIHQVGKCAACLGRVLVRWGVLNISE